MGRVAQISAIAFLAYVASALITETALAGIYCDDSIYRIRNGYQQRVSEEEQRGLATLAVQRWRMVPQDDLERRIDVATFNHCIAQLESEGRWDDALGELLPLAEPKDEISPFRDILAHKIGSIYLQRNDGKQDLAAAEQWLRRGQPAKDTLLACTIYRRDPSRINEAAAAMHEAAEAGKYPAMLEYSKYVRFGLGVPADPVVADNWLRMAWEARAADYSSADKGVLVKEFSVALQRDQCGPTDEDAINRLTQIIG